ncbi:hypothetical protein ECANGB1_1528 [Enterospora canceri]|uniref:t-SNARE coiled-coil homology domain-containing protein n=1 Tax=Enterospora canceri TaxID=1081671 RepID=A0A1Y1S5W1_9MICR|nr:hypothetical protein ECANGB1_1528 [Enterospora canceri]
MNSDLFNMAMSHCDVIKDDLDAQDEKLMGVHNKIRDYSDGLDFNEKYLQKLKKTANMKKTYCVIFAIGLVFTTAFIVIKIKK